MWTIQKVASFQSLHLYKMLNHFVKKIYRFIAARQIWIQSVEILRKSHEITYFRLLPSASVTS